MKKHIRELAAKVQHIPNGRALLVGGYVRDQLLGIASKDADIEVYGVPAKKLEALLRHAYPRRVNTVGRAFGVLKIAIGNGKDLDVALPRRESKTGAGHRGFRVEGDPGMTISEAARRRDFTINAIAQDPLTGKMEDPFDGAKDLKKKVLRVVDPKTFIEDPLRVYRAAQFVARFGLTVEPATMRLMKKMVVRGDLLQLSAERITEELKKMLLRAERPSRGFELLRELGVIKRNWKEIWALVGTPQEPEWHPEGDVWIHTMMVIDEAAKMIRQRARKFTEDEKLAVMVGSLCHDFGKPATTKKMDGRIRSLGHEAAGETPTRSFLSRLSFGETVRSAAIAIATQHLKPALLFRELERGTMTKDQYTNAVRKLVSRIHPVSWRILIASAEADYRGRGAHGPKKGVYEIGASFVAAIRRLKMHKMPPKPLLQGRDLVALGIQPGPEMGKMIQAVEDARDRGEVRTKKEALELLRSLM